MSVKCLSPDVKLSIVSNYRVKTLNQKQLAKLWGVSERTINRILNEAGVATAVPRIQGEAYQAMQILKKHNISVESLDNVLTEYLYGTYEAQSANETLYPVAT